MSPPHPSSPTPNRSPSGRVAVRPSSPPGLLTLHKLKLGFYKDPRVLDGPAPWAPVSQAIGRHLQGAGRSSSWRLSGVSPPSSSQPLQAPAWLTSRLLAPPLTPAQLARAPRSTPLPALPVMPRPHCPRLTPSPSAGPATSPEKGQRQGQG